MVASTWRVGGCVQGDRRHAGVARDRVLMRRMLMVRMGERVGLLVRGVIGVERFVACHQRVQHVEHHLRRCSGAATRRLTEWIRMIVPVRADDYGRRLPRRPRRLDARDARRDVPLMIPRPLPLLLPGAARSSTRTYSRRCTRAFVQSRASRTASLASRPRKIPGQAAREKIRRGSQDRPISIRRRFDVIFQEDDGFCSSTIRIAHFRR